MKTLDLAYIALHAAADLDRAERLGADVSDLRAELFLWLRLTFKGA